MVAGKKMEGDGNHGGEFLLGTGIRWRHIGDLNLCLFYQIDPGVGWKPINAESMDLGGI